MNLKLDKLLHLFVSFTIVIFLHKGLTLFNVEDNHAIILACIGAMFIGLAKEIKDSKEINNIFSIYDMFANMLGIVLSAIILVI